MIKLTRLNQKQFIVNCELIKYLEATPDTVITLTDGEKIMVLEKIDVIIQATIQYRQLLFQNPFLPQDLKSGSSGESKRELPGPKVLGE